MRIHIIGGSGTGKTYLAKRLSVKFNIPHFDLDDLFWDNTSSQYGVKMPVDKRNNMLNDILRKRDWIIEGVYYDWLDESFKEADTIVLLDIPKSVCRFRIICRFLKRKIGVESAKQETITSLINLLKWTNKFQNRNLPQIYAKLNNYTEKTRVLHRKREVNNYIKSV